MSNIKEILKESSVFICLGEDERMSLAQLFEKREIQAGDILATAEDAAQYFFLLNNGTVLLAMDEGKSVVLNKAGDFIGFELLSAKGVYRTTLTVLESGSVFAVPTQDFLAFIQKESVAATAIMTAWQGYLDKTASFAKNIEDISLPYNF